jgi:hypothetical protein
VWAVDRASARPFLSLAAEGVCAAVSWSTQKAPRWQTGLGWHHAQWRDRWGYWHCGRYIAGCAVVSKPLGSRPPELVTRLAGPRVGAFWKAR